MSDEREEERVERIPVMVRFSPALIRRVDSCARVSGVTRPEAIRAAAMSWCVRRERDEARRRRLEKA